jgi:hypothetical protein
MEFDETKAEQELAMPEGEFERFITGNPNVILDVLTYCSHDYLPLAIERVWQACWFQVQEGVQDGELDFAEEIGLALVRGLNRRLLDRPDCHTMHDAS